MAAFWEKLAELKNEHDLSNYVNRVGNVFNSSGEEGDPENQDPNNPQNGLEPPQIRVTEPGTGEKERRSSMASVVSSIMSIGPKSEDGSAPSEMSDKPGDVQNGHAVGNGTQSPQTAQPSNGVPESTDISKPPEVQTVQPLKPTNGVMTNGHHTVNMHTAPVKAGKAGAKGALVFSICTLILCPISLLCTIPSCICAIVDLKSERKSSSKLSTCSCMTTAMFFVTCAVVASFALGSIIFGGLSLLDQVLSIFGQLAAIAGMPDNQNMTTAAMMMTTKKMANGTG